MTSKFSWEPLDGGSLLLKVADGDRETTWKITKRTTAERVSAILYEASVAVSARKDYVLTPIRAIEPMRETVRTVDDVELAEIQADSERVSRAAQAARVAQLNIGAKWFEADDDETYGIPIPDYDAGEV